MPAAIGNSKECSKCRLTKSITEFQKDQVKKDGLRSSCKACRLLYQASPQAVASRRAYRARPEVKAKNRAWNKSPAGRASRRAYNTSLEARAKQREQRKSPNHKAREYSKRTQVPYDKGLPWFLIPKNVRLCWLCGENGEELQLDHDHENLFVRGWTHPNCNRAEGNIRCSPNPAALVSALYHRFAPNGA